MAPGACRTGAGAVVLHRGPLQLTLLPHRGACWAALLLHRPGQAPLPLLRPLPAGSDDLFASAAYVLVPYSNRLFGQRLLTGAGEALQIALNRPGIGDPVHGVGWMKAWTVQARADEAVTLACAHAADSHWPFDHVCQMRIALGMDRVVLHLRVVNRGLQPMPVGAGFHPFLAIDEDSVLSFSATGRWEQDAQGLPTRRVPADASAEAGLPAARLVLNHCFAGWSGPVRLRRPRHRIAVSLRADAALGHLQIYRPPGMPWLCAEPVSHATGAWSLPQVHQPDAGLRWLAPGGTFEVLVRLSVETDPGPRTA